jgi:hypothetical protein
MVRLLAHNHGLNEARPIADPKPRQEQATTDTPCTAFYRELLEA